MGCNGGNCSGCTGCTGDCSSCTGCSGCSHGGSLLITDQEIRVLEQLQTYAFLPVARKADTMVPHCMEEGMPIDSTLALQLLEKKSLVSLDYDRPLSNFSYEAYKGFPVHGYVRLTQRGQQVLELLEIQGFSEE